jgi:hypothetical protein
MMCQNLSQMPITLEWVTTVKPHMNSVEVQPQLSCNGCHPVDGALVGAGSLWPNLGRLYCAL